MIKDIAIGGTCAIVVVLVVWVHLKIVVGAMNVVAQATSKTTQLQGTSGLNRIGLLLSGWKTNILAWVAALFSLIAALPDDVMTSWTNLPWAQVVDQKFAAVVAIVCGILIPITHSVGLKKAALTPPDGPK